MMYKINNKLYKLQDTTIPHTLLKAITLANQATGLSNSRYVGVGNRVENGDFCVDIGVDLELFIVVQRTRAGSPNPLDIRELTIAMTNQRRELKNLFQNFSV